MGLGPPICERCLVFYTYKHSYGWECPICKQNSPEHLNLWATDYTEEELEGNLRFLQFIKGVGYEDGQDQDN